MGFRGHGGHGGHGDIGTRGHGSLKSHTFWLDMGDGDMGFCGHSAMGTWGSRGGTGTWLTQIT